MRKYRRLSVRDKAVIFLLISASASILFGAEVFFSGNTVMSDSIVDSLFSHNEIAAGINEVLLLYVESGYPFCEISIDSILQKGDKYINYASIKENGFYRVKSVVSTGTLSEGFINRLVKFNREPFRRTKVLRELYKVKRFDYADCEYIDDFYPSVVNDSEVVVEVKIDQIRRSYVTGVLATDFDTLKLTGFLDLSLINVFNDGAEYTMFFSKLSKYSSEMSISLKAPYMFSTPFGISGEMSYVSSDTLSAYLKTGLNFFTYAGSMTVYAGGGREWTFYPGMSDSNDSYYYLTSKAEYIHSRKSYGAIEAKKAFGRDQYSILKGDGFIAPELWNIRFLTKSGFFYLFAENMKLQMLLPLGGTRSIRGYPENFVYASKSFYCSFSPGYEITKYLTAGLFFEGAFYSISKENIFEKSLSSYGAYASMMAGRTQLDIGYALKRGAGPYEGRIHISTKYVF